MKKITLFAIFATILLTACSDMLLSKQEKQARTTVESRFKNSPAGDSYEPLAWGKVEHQSPYAGTGTENPLFGEVIPPSDYSITHRLRMRNGWGNETTYDVRIYFTYASCKEWAGMEYMDKDDPSRYELRENSK